MRRARRLLACAVLGLAACRGGVRSPSRLAAVGAATPRGTPAPAAPSVAPSAGPVAPVVARLRCEYYQISDG